MKSHPSTRMIVYQYPKIPFPQPATHKTSHQNLLLLELGYLIGMALNARISLFVIRLTEKYKVSEGLLFIS
jgi:hypothetical protein